MWTVLPGTLKLQPLQLDHILQVEVVFGAARCVSLTVYVIVWGQRFDGSDNVLILSA